MRKLKLCTEFPNQGYDNSRREVITFVEQGGEAAGESGETGDWRKKGGSGDTEEAVQQFP
jgi:hypothetical protein